MSKEIVAWLAVAVASFKFTPEITVAYTGVPINVLVACAIGSFCSFSFGERVEERRKMWGFFATAVFMGAAFTAISNAAMQHWLSVKMTDSLHAGLGAVIAFSMRFFLEWFVGVLKEGKWLSWIPFIRRDK